jgi:hypothetical protein
MRDLFTLFLCLITTLAPLPSVAAVTVPGETACVCHRACCSTSESPPAKPAPAVPSAKLSADGWQYQAEAVAQIVLVAPTSGNAVAFPAADARSLDRHHDVPLFVRHCCPLL